MTRRTRLVFPLALVLLTLQAALAQGVAAQTVQPSPAAFDSFRALPDAEMLMIVDVQRALRDLAPRVLAHQPKTLLQMNTGIAAFKATTGIDIRNVRRLVVALRNNSPEKMSKGEFNGVIIAEGIDTQKLLALLLSENKGKVLEENYQGQTLYVHPKSPDKPSEWEMCLTALDASTLMIGTPPDVRASLDAHAGRGTRVNAELLEAAMPRANSLLSMAFVFPPSFASSVSGMTKPDDPMKNVLSTAIASIKMFHGALGITPAGYDVLAAVKVTDADRAQAMRDALEGLRTLASMEAVKSEKDRMAQDLLKRITITSVGDEVQASTEIAQTTIDSIISSMNLTGNSNAPPVNKKAAPIRRTVRRKARR